MDEKLRIFADLYARYDSEHCNWLEDGGDIEGPWQRAMDGLLGYADRHHGIAGWLIIKTAKSVEL
jgi:hypothetical protein